jgi:hypothetical protein
MVFIYSITHTKNESGIINGMSLCSIKSVIDRYGRAKEEEHVADPNTELKVHH